MDRGPEIWNSLMRELYALLRVFPRPGTGFRPVEQAPIEREHQEFRKLEGAFLHDIFKGFPTEWDEMLIFAEHIRNNTPVRKTGVTPRDLDKKWSLASPLERELICYDESAQMAVSDIAKKQFQDWQLLRGIVLQHLGRERVGVQPTLLIAIKDPSSCMKVTLSWSRTPSLPKKELVELLGSGPSLDSVELLGSTGLRLISNNLTVRS